MSAPRTVTAAELLAMNIPAPRWVIPELLCEGLTIVAGRPKIGKSWLMLSLAVAVASGGVALGRYPCEAAEALYLALEDSPARVRSRLIQVLGESPAPARLHLQTSWPRLDDGGLDALLEWLTQHPACRLVVIDTLKRIRPRANGLARSIYDLDYEALQPLVDLAQSRGIATIVVHHTRKTDADDPLDLVSGSTGLTGAADAVWVLKRARGETDAVLAVVGRDLEDQELALHFDRTTGCWTVVGDAREVQLSRERLDVLELLASAESLALRDIADRLGLSPKSAWWRLNELVKEGYVQQDGRGRYRLASTPRNPRNLENVPENRDTTRRTISSDLHQPSLENLENLENQPAAGRPPGDSSVSSVSRDSRDSSVSSVSRDSRDSRDSSEARGKNGGAAHPYRCSCGGRLGPSDHAGWLRCDRCRQFVRSVDPALRRR